MWTKWIFLSFVFSTKASHLCKSIYNRILIQAQKNKPSIHSSMTILPWFFIIKVEITGTQRLCTYTHKKNIDEIDYINNIRFATTHETKRQTKKKLKRKSKHSKLKYAHKAQSNSSICIEKYKLQEVLYTNIAINQCIIPY